MEILRLFPPCVLLFPGIEWYTIKTKTENLLLLYKSILQEVIGLKDKSFNREFCSFHSEKKE